MAGDDEPVVLGLELAAARVADELARAAAVEPSPLGEVRYSGGAGGLWRWVEAPQDAVLSGFVAEFARLDDAGRARVRASLTMDDFYALLTFAHRGALAALRERDAGAARMAVDVLAAVAIERVDWRDVHVAAGVAGWVVQRLGLDPAEVAGAAAGRAEPDVGEVLIRVAGQPQGLGTWGYREVQTATGPVFFQDEHRPFDPDFDLGTLAIEVAAVVEADGAYRVGSLNAAVQVPDIWLGGDTSGLRGLRGCVSVHADPRERPGTAFLLIYLADAGKPRFAARIARSAQRSSTSDAVRFGVADGCLCAVVLARTMVRGAEPVDDAASLDRFRPGVAAALSRAAGSGGRRGRG